MYSSAFSGTFTGEGSSKKMAKAVAARDALRNEFNIIVVDGDDGDSTMPKHRKRHIEMANTKNPVQLLYELCLVQVLKHILFPFTIIIFYR